MKVVLDTNAVMAVGEFGIDIFSELQKCCDSYTLCVVEGSLRELKGIVAEQQGKYKRAATLGLELLKAKRVRILKSSGHVDDVLAAYSKKGALILTQDQALKKKLTKPYLTIRQKKRVVKIG
jgi:rRNA-processing protein FCF1